MARGPVKGMFNSNKKKKQTPVKPVMPSVDGMGIRPTPTPSPKKDFRIKL